MEEVSGVWVLLTQRVRRRAAWCLKLKDLLNGPPGTYQLDPREKRQDK